MRPIILCNNYTLKFIMICVDYLQIFYYLVFIFESYVILIIGLTYVF